MVWDTGHVAPAPKWISMDDWHMAGIKVLAASEACLALVNVHGEEVRIVSHLIDGLFTCHNLGDDLLQQLPIQEEGLCLWVDLCDKLRGFLTELANPPFHPSMWVLLRVEPLKS